MESCYIWGWGRGVGVVERGGRFCNSPRDWETRYMLVLCWAAVCDTGPALTQHRDDVAFLLTIDTEMISGGWWPVIRSTVY